MQRRNFIKNTTAFIAGASTAPNILFAKSENPMDRIGMTTVVFRNRFEATQKMGIPNMANPLTLQTVPEYYADRFNIHNLEFWSLHFESQAKSYLNDIRIKIENAHSKLINIQIDGKYNLADSDENKRRESIEYIKSWVDTAAIVGSKSIRANTGRGTVELTIKSFQELNAYALTRGVMLLVENHMGKELDPDTHLRILNEIDSPNCRAIADFGNYKTDELRFAALKKIMPLTHLISAKVVELDEKNQHSKYDFETCLEIAKNSNFSGIYSIEQWNKEKKALDHERLVDWAIEQIKAFV